jgi:hypothetical protein
MHNGPYMKQRSTRNLSNAGLAVKDANGAWVSFIDSGGSNNTRYPRARQGPGDS